MSFLPIVNIFQIKINIYQSISHQKLAQLAPSERQENALNAQPFLIRNRDSFSIKKLKMFENTRSRVVSPIDLKQRLLYKNWIAMGIKYRLYDDDNLCEHRRDLNDSSETIESIVNC